MAAAIVATVKGSTSNSYVTVAEAETYVEGRLNSDSWNDATPTEKIQALITAARRLQQVEGLEGYQGTRTDVSTPQALAWPRIGAYDPDGNIYDSEAIPLCIQQAQYELAIMMLTDDLVVDTGLEGFNQVTVGPISVTPNNVRKSGALPAAVMRELAHVLVNQPGSIRLERA